MVSFKYVLLFIYLHGNPRLPITIMQEWNSKESCTAALVEIRATYKLHEERTRENETVLKAVCLPK